MSFRDQSLLLRTSLGLDTGYGRDGLYLAKLLAEQGADLHVEPTYVGIPLPPIVASLFVKHRPNHFDLSIEHTDPGALFQPARLTNVTNRSIAWTMWEFTSFEGELFEGELKDRLQWYDDVFVYDATSKQAMDPYHPNVRILQGGYVSDEWRPNTGDDGLGGDAQRNWDGTFRFAMVGQLHQRKNPFAAIKAFNILKARHGASFDAELHLKTTMASLHPAMEQTYPGVKIWHVGWSHPQMRRFYQNTHCYLSPSWGEGKNLPALEAQTMGVPAIVSKVGGHLQWGDSSWNYWCEGEMVPRSPQMLTKMHMEVDVEDLADKMWHVYTHREEARAKGELASRTIPAQCDWEPVVGRLEAMLHDSRPTHMRPVVQDEPESPVVNAEDLCPECGEIAVETAVGVRCTKCDWEYVG